MGLYFVAPIFQKKTNEVEFIWKELNFEKFIFFKGIKRS